MTYTIKAEDIRSIYPGSTGLRPGWRIELKCGGVITAEFITGLDSERQLWVADAKPCTRRCDRDCPLREVDEYADI